MFCKFCGKPIDDDARFCSQCGATLDESSIGSRISTSGNMTYPVYGLSSSVINYFKNWNHCMALIFTLWGISALLFYFGNWFRITIYQSTMKYSLVSAQRINDGTLDFSGIIEPFSSFVLPLIAISLILLIIRQREICSLVSVFTPISIILFVILCLAEVSSTIDVDSIDGMIIDYICDITFTPYLIIILSIISVILSICSCYILKAENSKSSN